MPKVHHLLILPAHAHTQEVLLNKHLHDLIDPDHFMSLMMEVHLPIMSTGKPDTVSFGCMPFLALANVYMAAVAWGLRRLLEQPRMCE